MVNSRELVGNYIIVLCKQSGIAERVGTRNGA